MTAPSTMAGRVALVTGAAGDIGRAISTVLAEHGASVVLADLGDRTDALASAAAGCRELAPDAVIETMSLDVVDDSKVRAAIAEVVADIGVPDAIVNSAGYQGRFRSTIDYPLDDFRRVLEINVVGLFNVLQASAAALRTADRPGAVVNLASMAGLSGPPNMAAYTASKSAVIGLTKTAAKDLAGSSIRVNAVSPGFIGPGDMWDRQVRLQADAASPYYPTDPALVEQQMIDQIPLRRVGGVEEVAAVVRFLLSEEASYLSGTNVEVSGGAA